MLQVEERSWNEFWAEYWRIEQRHRIPGIFAWDRQLVNFVEHVCELSPGQRILDLGCGGGDQAKVFAQKGYEVVGVDIAPSLIAYAREQFEREGLAGTFVVGDMRDIGAIDDTDAGPFPDSFDACVLLSGTFGFFGEEEDREILRAIRRTLKDGGRVFVNFLVPKEFNGREKTWSETDDGWNLRETCFDAETSTYHSRTFIVRKDGVIIKPRPEPGYHAEETIRCYTIPEMQKMLVVADLRYVASYSSRRLALPPQPLAPDTARNVVVAER
ncbi:MAG TPA: class I SAM-dependent methyltransferase [Chloroflexi bacterium]|nr:class I SAM-dependent methyltransferase [Chloroflexota bacterium]